MNQTQFVAEVFSVASASNPDLDDSSSFQDVLKELTDIKDKALRMDIIVSSFKPEPELFPVRPTLKETQARRQTTMTNDELIRKDNERILKQLRALDAYINRKKNDHRR